MEVVYRDWTVHIHTCAKSLMVLGLGRIEVSYEPEASNYTFSPSATNVGRRTLVMKHVLHLSS